MKISKPTDADRDRFTALVPDGPAVEIKPMFGNLGAFVNGNMFMALFGGDVGVKLPDEDRSRLLTEPGTGPFGPAERPMADYVTVPASWSPRTAKTWTAGPRPRRPYCHPSRPRRRRSASRHERRRDHRDRHRPTRPARAGRLPEAACVDRCGAGSRGDLPILVVADAGYDITRLAQVLADLRIELVGWVRSDRVLRLPKPVRMPGATGRPPKHGPEIALDKSATSPQPQHITSTVTARYGNAVATSWGRLRPGSHDVPAGWTTPASCR